MRLIDKEVMYLEVSNIAQTFILYVSVIFVQSVGIARVTSLASQKFILT